MDLSVRLGKEHMFFLIASIVVVAGIGFAVAQAPSVYHDPSEIYPQGVGSGLDADTVDGWQGEELGDPTGCFASPSSDPSGAHELAFVCWNRNLKKIWACAYQLTHDGAFNSANSGNCQVPVIPSEFWAGEGTVHFCSVAASDIAGAHEFAYSCSGTNGVLACAAQMTHQGEWHSGEGECQFKSWA